MNAYSGEASRVFSGTSTAADAGHGVVQLEHRGDVREQHRDAVAGLDAELVADGRGGAADALVVLGVGPRLVARDDGGAVLPDGGAALEEPQRGQDRAGDLGAQLLDGLLFLRRGHGRGITLLRPEGVVDSCGLHRRPRVGDGVREQHEVAQDSRRDRGRGRAAGPRRGSRAR